MGSEIRRVIDKGICFEAGPLKIHLLQTGSKLPNRTAFAVPRYGRTVVTRNKLRRRLQELARLFPIQSEGCLAVVRISPGCYEDSFRELEKRFSSLVDRINLKLCHFSANGPRF